MHNNNPKGIVPAVVRPKYDLEFKDFWTPVEECIRRDASRPNPIGEKVIKEQLSVISNEKVKEKTIEYFI